MCSSSPFRIAETSAAHSISSSRVVAKNRPLAWRPPSGPTVRCAATRRRSSGGSRSGRPNRPFRYRCRVRARRWRQLLAVRLSSAAIRRQAGSAAKGFRDAEERRSSPSRSPERMGDAFRQPPRIHKNQRRAVRQDEFRHAIVDLVPHLGAGDGAQFVARNFYGQIHLAAVSDVDDSRVRAEQAGHFFDRLHGRGKADSLRPVTRSARPGERGTATDASLAYRRPWREFRRR